MSERNTWARTVHDLGLAIWMGGSLMGAVGLNAAAKQATEPTDRIRVANAGWARWTPVNAIGIAAYAGGGAALMMANKGRLAGQAGVGRATLAKNLLSLVTLGATVYARVLGQRLMEQDGAPVEDGTTPTPETPSEVRNIQRQLKLLQYAIPVHVGGLIAITALMGEQQRTSQVASGVARRLLPAG
jgi:uncharacterized membrane protein